MSIDKNIHAIKAEITKKNYSTPYFVGSNAIYNVSNDYDEFPYPRWYKGEYKKSYPIVAEREAGWRPKNTYVPNIPRQEDVKPSICYQSPCSTIYPCYSQDNSYYMLNKACVKDYR